MTDRTKEEILGEYAEAISEFEQQKKILKEYKKKILELEGEIFLKLKTGQEFEIDKKKYKVEIEKRIKKSQ